MADVYGHRGGSSSSITRPRLELLPDSLSLKSSGGRLCLSFVSCICILHTPHAYEVYSTNRLRYMYMMYVCCRVALMQPEMELTSALGRTRR